MQRQSALILGEVIVSLYPENSYQRTPENYQQLMGLVMHLLKNPSSYQDCLQTSVNLTGTSQPIERLHDILSVGNDPIPFNGDAEVEEANIRKKSRTWTTYEDDRLIAGIYRYGIDNWTSISRFVGNGRTRSQCSQRWQRGLDPHLSKDQWSVQEEAFLLQLVAYYGEKSWTQIASKMGNRSDVQCRYRYKQMQKDRNLHARSIATANNMQYGAGVRKTQSSFLPQMIPQQHNQQQQIQQQQNFFVQQQQHLGNRQIPPAIPNRHVQPQIFPDEFQMNNTRLQIPGNLRPSQSVPAIQFQPIPQLENAGYYKQNQSTSITVETPPPVPPPPLPRPPSDLRSGRPSNSDFLFDVFNESFFDDNDFDLPAAPVQQINEQASTPSSIPPPQQPPQNLSAAQQQQQQPQNNQMETEDTSFSLPTFDSDLFALF